VLNNPHASSGTEKDYFNNCIGSLEHHVHNVFASVRVPGEDFVYSASIDLFNKLDDYCDNQPTARQESKSPFLIKGESGTGKSALLSNWLHRRERNATRSKTNSPLGEEFLFWHAVGCSRQSMNVNFLIRRLIVDLKNRFELARDIPKSQERLSWELPRFLELAAKKGRVIIVIDGLNRLVNNDNVEDGLTWLPLQFPPNVRFILSVTTPPSLGETTNLSSEANAGSKKASNNENNDQKLSDKNQGNARKEELNDISERGVNNIRHKNRKSRILQELERRNIPFIVLKPLERNLCRSLVETFIAKSVNFDNAALATGPYVSMYFDNTASTEKNAINGGGNMTENIAGFLLFESQINSLLAHPEGGTPLFLRLFLRCLQFAVSRGYSLWNLFEEWLKVKSIPELLHKILLSFEEGSVCSRESSQLCCDKTVEAGGLPALKAMYSWHPSFQSLKPAADISNMMGAYTLRASRRQGESEPNVSSPSGGGLNDKNPQGNNAAGNGQNGPQNSSALDSFNVQMAAHIAEGALSESNSLTKANNLSSPEKGNNNANNSNGGAGKNVSQLVLQSLTDQQMNEVSQQADLKLQLALKQSQEVIEDAMMRTREKVDNVSSAVFMQELVSLMREAQMENSKQLQRDQNGFSLKVVTPIASLKAQNNFLEVVDGSNDSLASQSASKRTGDNFSESKSSYSNTNSDGESDLGENASVDTANSFDKLADDVNVRGSVDFKNSSTGKSPQPLQKDNTFVGMRSILRQSLQPQPLQQSQEIDPSDGLNTLPIYLRGGISTVGFGDLLGNALALLYVSRQGLREKELWKILSRLQFRAEQEKRADYASKEIRVANNEIIRQLATQLINSRGSLLDIFKAEDLSHSGFIPISNLLLGTRKLFPSTTKSDFAKLLDFMEKNTPNAPSKSNNGMDDDILEQPLQQGGKVNYAKLIDGLLKLNRHYKFKDAKLSGLMNSTSTIKRKKTLVGKSSLEDDNDDDDYDNFNLNLSPSSKRKLLASTSKRSVRVDDDDDSNSQSQEAKTERESIEIEGDTYSLGPVIEESLLAILCALGVLYSPENKLLILPSDSEPFRVVIYEQYILKRGGCTLQYWHQQVIQYFQTEPNSLRKCEELPWHLKICKKWSALRDTLVDLKTFDLMYNNDLKDELMDYWLLLTEGPLHVHDPVTDAPINGANSNHGHNNSPGRLYLFNKVGNAYKEDSDDNDSENNILRDIDKAMAINSSLKELRKNTMKSMVQPFDIVEELNKSVEHWVTVTKPQPAQMNKVINQISKFLAEFSKLAKSSPRFLRVGIDLHSVALFGITFDEIKSDIAVNNHSSLGVNGDGAEDKDKESNSMFETVIKEGPAQFPTDAMLAAGKNLYPYLRWVWMQFPWIALHPAASLASVDSHPPAHNGSISMESSGEMGEDGMPLPQSYQGPTTNENERLLRVWNCKKTDPTVPVFQKSAHRQVASLKPRLLTSLSLEKSVEVALGHLYDEMLTESEQMGMQTAERGRRGASDDLAIPSQGIKHIPGNGRRSDSVNKKQAADKSLNEFSMSANSSLITKKSHSKFKMPKFDIEAALAGQQYMVNEHGHAANVHNNNTFLTEIDDELQNMNADDFIMQQRLQQMKMQEYHAQVKRNAKDEQMLEYGHMLERISKMKNIWNKLDIVHRDKTNILLSYEKQILMRRESDMQLVNEVNAGETLIKDLGERNIAIERSLNDARTINEGYMQLIKALKNNAPFREAHVKSLEIELELAERQFKDLCQHRNTLYKDVEKLEAVKRKEIADRVSYFASARAEIALKKAQVEQEMRDIASDIKNKKLFSKSNAMFHVPTNNGNHGQHGRKNKWGGPNGGEANSLTSTSTSAAASRHSSNPEQPLNISKPLATFLNVLMRKKTYNTTTIKEGDTLQSLRKVDVFKAPSETNVPEYITLGGSSDRGNDNSLMEKVRKAGNTMILIQEEEDNGDNNYGIIEGDSVHATDMKARRKPELSGGKVNDVPSNNSGRQQARSQVQKLIKYLLEKTESSSVDEFLDRFNQNKKLVDILNNQQMLLDSQLSQLRTEHQELSALRSDMSFVGEEPLKPTEDSDSNDNEKPVMAATPKSPVAHTEEFMSPTSRKAAAAATEPSGANSTTTGSLDEASISNSVNQSMQEDENDDRYIDSKLFAKEVRLRQLQLLNKNSVYIINEVRTAVEHVTNIIMLNESLLASLPKVAPPPLKEDSDIILCLLWCEDRLIAVNEALSMETNKPSGGNTADDSKTLSQRQNELATLIMQSASKDAHKRQQGRLRSAEKKPKKQNGGLSKIVINSNDANLPQPGAVMVTAAAKIDSVYDSKVAKLCAERDKRQDLIESKRMYAEGSEKNNDLQKFLAGGIDQKTTKDLTRKAGQLVNKRRGRQENYGLVLQDLIESKGQTVSLQEKGKSTNATNPAAMANKPTKPNTSNGGINANNHGSSVYPSITATSTVESVAVVAGGGSTS